jgi:hypothetical protein
MTDAKLVRFAAVLTVLAGYAFVFRAGESQIDGRIAENAHIAEQLRDGERTLASRAVLLAERARLRAQLRSADVTADRSAIVARFLRHAAVIAAEHHAAITAITAGGTVPITTSRTPAPSGPLAGRSEARSVDEPFEEISLEVTVEGRYADVLATIRALPAGRVLASVDVTSLARKNAASADGTLTASLRVVLERIAPLPTLESAGAPPRPV